MICLRDCINEDEKKVGANRFRLVTIPVSKLDAIHDFVISKIPIHYASLERIGKVFEDFGKSGVAKLLEIKLPVEKIAQSADLGEIFATEYVKERTNYLVPINRLQWKSHRDMSMHGDDVTGFRISDKDSKIFFLKVESKSRNSLIRRTIEEARETLEKEGGLPTGHTLAYISERLFESGNEFLSDAIDRAQLREGISDKQVTHMIFIFSETDSEEFLKDDLENYNGKISQLSVGLKIDEHQNFIASVFDKVLNSDES